VQTHFQKKQRQEGTTENGWLFENSKKKGKNRGQRGSEGGGVCKKRKFPEEKRTCGGGGHQWTRVTQGKKKGIGPAISAEHQNWVWESLPRRKGEGEGEKDAQHRESDRKKRSGKAIRKGKGGGGEDVHTFHSKFKKMKYNRHGKKKRMEGAKPATGSALSKINKNR